MCSCTTPTSVGSTLNKLCVLLPIEPPSRTSWTKDFDPVVDIARKLHINDRTVRKIVAPYRQRGHHQPLPKPGRPRTVNVPGIRKIIKKRIKRNDQVSLNTIASDLNTT
ncbi:unnamed protein product [Nippostrongylus brasiliensis]|uniref:Transposase n=1 Tax=Nippostrongylus brasiliensis TaxID=27835 RepID=A0A0N4YKY0_NIPBR|nr:unnamed protein product [Nippostrongylus brasiliensis]